mmetsp:Transcript_13164/g.14625  ORF Transcript_13164/g.14625 Transcript_13164/m.14625 type:complete len:127 (-) Transcript_13164:914-1294(-)
MDIAIAIAPIPRYMPSVIPPRSTRHRVSSSNSRGIHVPMTDMSSTSKIMRSASLVCHRHPPHHHYQYYPHPPRIRTPRNHHHRFLPHLLRNTNSNKQTVSSISLSPSSSSSSPSGVRYTRRDREYW